MKVKRKFFLTIGLVTIVVTLFFSLQNFIFKEKKTEREKYELFLEKQFEKINTVVSSDLSAIPKPGQPDMAAYQDFLQTLDPKLGYIPPKRLTNTYKLIKKQYNNKSSNTIDWQNTPVKMGGRIRSLMFDPNDANGNKVWAGSVTGGLWYNNNISDEESSWMPANDFWDKLSISSITYDPNNTQTFYVGTGEAETAVVTYRESSGLGVGIWKTTDGGETWTLLEATEDFIYITDIVVRDENGTSVIYAGVASGYYQGINQTSTPNDGLYRSADGGNTWEQVLPNITGSEVPYTPSDIELTADGRIFVGTMLNTNDQGGGTILFSDLGTSGSWTVNDDYVSVIENNYYDIPGRVKLSSAPSNENVVYAAIASGSDEATDESFRTFICEVIIKTTDKGENWTTINIPEGYNNWAYLSWHALVLKVDPNNENTLWAGGLDLWRTKNGGTSWSHLSDWSAMYNYPNDYYVHADQHDIAFKQNNSNKILFSTDGGVFCTNNGTSSSPVFEERNKNLNTLQYYSCAMPEEAGVNHFLGGLQDNGTLMYTGEALTPEHMISGGDGAYCFIDKNQNISISSVYDNQYYVFVNDYDYYYSHYDGSSGTFTSPAAYDSDLNILYSNKVTFDGNYTNKILVADIPELYPIKSITVGSGFNVPFSHLKVSPYSSKNTTTLFAGTMSGRLFKVENANTSPNVTEITGVEFPTASISSVDFGEDEETIIVSFSNFGVESIWITYDGGENWESKQSNLPDLPVRWLICHPKNRNQVMIATEIGIWTTNNIIEQNVVWEKQTSFPNVRVDMLQVRESDNTVLAAGHGRGLFYGFWQPVQVDLSDIEEKPYVIYPNPSNGIFTIDNALGYNLQIENITGKIIHKEILKSDKTKIDISSEAKGIYFVNIFSENKKYSSKIIVQ